MPSFDSPLGNKKFSGTPMREFDVPDESESYKPIQQQQQRYVAGEAAIREMQMRMQQEEDQRDPVEIEKEIRAAKEARRTGKERLNEGAKRRLEILLGMTRTTHTADVGGNEFVFQSLKAKEMREAIVAAAEYDNTVQSPFEIRKQFLARSIVTVAGVDFAQFIGSDSLEAKLIFIEELDDALLNRLYDEYLKLAKEAREKFTIKNSEEAAAVVDDLKK